MTCELVSLLFPLETQPLPILLPDRQYKVVKGSEVPFSQFCLAVANQPALGVLANTFLRGIYISRVTQLLMCIIDKILNFSSIRNMDLCGVLFCPSWTPPAIPSWTPQVSPSWTLCCLEGTSFQNFLVAFDSKRIVADLFSD